MVNDAGRPLRLPKLGLRLLSPRSDARSRAMALNEGSRARLLLDSRLDDIPRGGMIARGREAAAGGGTLARFGVLAPVPLEVSRRPGVAVPVAVPLRALVLGRFSGDGARDMFIVSLTGLKRIVLVEVLRLCPGLDRFLLGDRGAFALKLESEGEATMAGVRLSTLR